MMKISKRQLVIKNFKYMFPLLLKKSPQTVVLMVVSALVNSIKSLFGVVMPAKIIEELTGARNADVLLLYVLIIVLGTLVLNALSTLFNNLLSYYSSKADFHIDEMLNNKVTKVDYHNIEDPQFIDLLNRAKKGMNQYSGGIYSFIYAFQNIVWSIFTISGVITIIFASRLYILFILSLFALISNNIIYRKIQNRNQEFRNYMVRFDRKLWYYNKNITSFRQQKELRLYDGKKLIKDTVAIENPKAFKEYNKLTNKLIQLNTVDSVVYYIITNLLTILVLGYSVINDHINIGNWTITWPTVTIAAFSMLWQSINTFDSAMSQLIYSLNDYLKACEYQNDFIDLMNIESDFITGKEPINKIETIEFKNVSFKYPRTENYILKNVSFKIDSKDKVSLVGLNGAGKTTIIKLLCRFYKVEEGEILVNGRNINEYEYETYMKNLAIVFQDFKIISFNIKSNIAILDENKEKFDDVLKRAQVYDKVQSLPNKEYTYINKWFDKNGVEFSGGEMQKFAIARALYKESDLVILDEPTSALDPVAEAEIYYHFNEIVGRKLTIFISHRLSSCIFSDRIMVLDGSKIAEVGKHTELMKKENGLYRKMFEAQATYYQD